VPFQCGFVRECLRVTEVVSAVDADIPSWLGLVGEGEPLFGPMPDFETHLRRGIARGTALCVRSSSDAVVGGMLLSGPTRAAINWLAVRSTARRQGVGSALVAEAICRFPPSANITVDTFGEDNLEGQSARRLYESFGFVASEPLPNGPEGGTRQRFRLAPSP